MASGFVARVGEQLFLVTASHAADETHLQSRLIYRNVKGESHWARFTVFFQAASNPWIKHATADLAIARLDQSDRSRVYMQHLADLAIELDDFLDRSPDRMTKIEASGYPMRLGSTSPTRPLVVPANVSSVESPLEKAWGETPVLYCSPAIAQGTSGGLAFLSEGDSSSVAIVGVYVGVNFDDTGGKLSKLVPAHVVRKFLERYAPNFNEQAEESESDQNSDSQP